MDLETLEYMGKRVDGARDIVEQIGRVAKTIAYLTEKEVLTVHFRVGRDTITRVGRDTITLDDKDVICNCLITVIETLEEQREKLQKDLDEI